MPSISVSSRLTVYFDGQFWVAFFEREEDGALSVARHVFGPKPSLPEIAALVAGPRWSRLRFMHADADEARAQLPPSNPKRRQREAAREARTASPSTRAQDALKAALEEQKAESAASRRERRAAAAEERWAQRVAKRKEKKRGH